MIFGKNKENEIQMQLLIQNCRAGFRAGFKPEFQMEDVFIASWQLWNAEKKQPMNWAVSQSSIWGKRPSLLVEAVNWRTASPRTEQNGLKSGNTKFFPLRNDK